MKSQKIKILIIADGYPTQKNLTCGIFVKQQLDSLKNICPQYKFDIYYNPFFKLINDPINKKGKLWTILKWLLQMVCFLPYLFRRYDLVHAHRFSLPAINGASYKLFHGVPLVVSSHSITQVEKHYNSHLFGRFFRYCDQIIAMNHEMRDDFITAFHLDPKKIITRSCGIDFPEFDKNYSTDKLPHKTQIAGFVGDYSDNKRPFMFIDGIERLKDRFPLRGIMIGGGDHYQEIERSIKEKGLPITQYGAMAHSELISHYADFDFLLFPSASETFGIVGIEALYSGVPVISSAVGGKKDYIKDGVNGLLFKKDNIDDMVEKMEFCLSHPDRLKKMKQAAKSSVMSYSNLIVAQDLQNMYKRLLKQGKDE